MTWEDWLQTDQWLSWFPDSFICRLATVPSSSSICPLSCAQQPRRQQLPISCTVDKRSYIMPESKVTIQVSFCNSQKLTTESIYWDLSRIFFTVQSLLALLYVCLSTKTQTKWVALKLLMCTLDFSEFSFGLDWYLLSLPTKDDFALFFCPLRHSKKLT